jgi:hypothetical protein
MSIIIPAGVWENSLLNSVAETGFGVAMGVSRWMVDKTIYLMVLALFVLMCITIFWYNSGFIDYYTARVYLEVFTGIATLALLFYAYSNATSKREEDTARLELAVRPILAWEIMGKGKGAALTYRSIKHPIYDLHCSMKLGAEALNITDRHVDVYDEQLHNHHDRDITEFVRRGLGKGANGEISVRFFCHSEVGGRYEFEFSKEVTKQKNGFAFHHRKLVSAKYPWKEQKILFNDGAD